MIAIGSRRSIKGWRQPPGKPKHWLLSVWSLGLYSSIALLLTILQSNQRADSIIDPRGLLYGIATIAIVTIGVILRVVYKNSLFSRPAIGARHFALQDFLNTLPDARGIFDQMREEVSGNRLDVRSELFRSHMDELRFELKTFIRIYLWSQFNRLLKMLAHGVVSVIFTFACTYACLLAASEFAQFGQVSEITSTGTLLLDSLRYSAGTFATVGFDLPADGVLVSIKLLTIAQITISLFFLSIAASLASDFVQITNMINPGDLADSIENELRGVSRYQTIIEIPGTPVD